MQDIKLSTQVGREYTMGLNYVRNKRRDKRDSYEKLLSAPKKQGQVKVHLIWKYVQLFMSVTLLDELDVDFIPLSGFLAKEIAINAKRIAEFDQEAMNKFELDFEIYFNTAMHGCGIAVFDGYDEIEQKPEARSIDPLSVIPDPLNWKNSDVRFFGWSRKSTLQALRDSGAYMNLDLLALGGSYENSETRLNRQAIDQARDYTTQYDLGDTIEVYDHFTTYEGKKWLTSWDSSRTILIRKVEIEPHTEAERKKPSSIKFPIEIYRLSPIPGDFFGASMPDLVGQYQDQISVLTNLQMILARKSALGTDKFIKAGTVSAVDMKGKQPGGRYIPVKVGPGERVSDVLTEIREDGYSQFPDIMKQDIMGLAEETTGVGAIAFGQSPAGGQTKAEIQTIQKNSNQLLGYMTTFVQRATKGFWTQWYRSYSFNLSPKDKKYIVLTRGSQVDSYGFDRKDFISDDPVFVRIESKGQQAIKKREKFARMQVLSGTLLPNMKPGSYEFNDFMRSLAESAGMDPEEAMRYVKYTPAEQRAIENLELINRNENAPSPKPGEDFNTYLSIYSLAIDTDAKDKAISEYRQAYIDSGSGEAEQLAQGGTTNATAVAQAGGIVSSELSASSSTPSTQDI